MVKQILYSRGFIKNYNKRIAPFRNLSGRFDDRMRLFSKDGGNTLLKDHRLTGSKNDMRAFSVTGDVRLVYKKIDKNTILLMDVGTHNQVY